jgi:hypothetical protein
MYLLIIYVHIDFHLWYDMSKAIDLIHMRILRLANGCYNKNI